MKLEEVVVVRKISKKKIFYERKCVIYRNNKALEIKKKDTREIITYLGLNDLFRIMTREPTLFLKQYLYRSSKHL